jgi:hypothetical protein
MNAIDINLLLSAGCPKPSGQDEVLSVCLEHQKEALF